MNTQSNANSGNVIFVSHGGGPLPLMDDIRHQDMIKFLRKLSDKTPTLEAIIIISAHWEAPSFSVNNCAQPELLYDYKGFPPEAYEYTYPAPGHKDLANDIFELLSKSNIPSIKVDERGWDHGVFVPLLLAYPKADIPVIQLSLIESLNPIEHIRLGEALRPLMKRNILIIGSGFTFHNLDANNWKDTAEHNSKNDAFQTWLVGTCTGNIAEAERLKLLTDWESAPHARYCHPREEHLLPLLVCQAVSGQAGQVIFDKPIAGKRSLAFLW